MEKKSLLIPTLKVMNEAIENHIQLHREQLKDNTFREHQVAICLRLNLMMQVLENKLNQSE